VETIQTKRHRHLVAALVAERKKAGISQIELAKKLKRSQTFVTRMETGRRRIDVVEYLELAEVIGFDAAKLIEALQRVPHVRIPTRGDPAKKPRNERGR